jgi:predicted phage-related endonuclease
MTQYINKAAVVAEIENRIKELQNLCKENEEKLNSIQKTAILLCIDECKVILSFLDTSEVKEVNLYEDADNYWGTLTSDIRNSIYLNDFYKIAKHFFELGIRAQKGEKV